MHAGLVDVARQHLINDVTLDRFVSTARCVMLPNLRYGNLIVRYLGLFELELVHKLVQGCLLGLDLTEHPLDQVLQQAHLIYPVSLVLAYVPQLFIQCVDVSSDTLVVPEQIVQIRPAVIQSLLRQVLVLLDFGIEI